MDSNIPSDREPREQNRLSKKGSRAGIEVKTTGLTDAPKIE